MLTDNDKMPYGKHEGIEMANVPAIYLLWLYENNKCNKEVKDYIEYNLEVIKSEISYEQKKQNRNT